MKQTKFIVYGFIVMMLAACSSEETALKALEDNEIKLTTRVEGMLQTKAGVDEYQMNTKLLSGRTLNVYIVDHETGEGVQGTTTYGGYKGYASYTVGENGSLTSTSKPQYPAGRTVDIYALYGCNHDMNDSHHLGGLDGTLTSLHSQDIMYALEKDKSNNGGQIVLTFHHVMSKVNVIINPGSTEKVINGAEVSCFVSPGTAFLYNDMEHGLQLKCESHSADRYNELKFGTYSEGGVTGIFVPQIREVNSENPLFSIKLTDGTTYKYFHPTAFTFESGKEYTFNLTLVDNYSATATTSITGWDDSSETKNVDLQ